jgi:hypothetical protein
VPSSGSTATPTAGPEPKAAGVSVAAVTPVDVFAWVASQGARRDMTGCAKAVTLRQLGAAVSTVNRRIAGVRAFFEYLVMTEVREDNPVPAPRRGQGLRPAVRGLLGHLEAGRARRGWRLCSSPAACPNRCLVARSMRPCPRCAPRSAADEAGCRRTEPRRLIGGRSQRHFKGDGGQESAIAGFTTLPAPAPWWSLFPG